LFLVCICVHTWYSCIYVCVCGVCIYICIYMHIYIYTWKYVYMHIYVYTYLDMEYIHTWKYVYMHMYMYTYLDIYWLLRICCSRYFHSDHVQSEGLRSCTVYFRRTYLSYLFIHTCEFMYTYIYVHIYFVTYTRLLRIFTYTRRLRIFDIENFRSDYLQWKGNGRALCVLGAHMIVEFVYQYVWNYVHTYKCKFTCFHIDMTVENIW